MDVKNKLEICRNCLEKSSTVTYYAAINKTWCADCHQEWIEWMISCEENERSEEAVKDIKSDRVPYCRYI
jgi:hypothetical protein